MNPRITQNLIAFAAVATVGTAAQGAIIADFQNDYATGTPATGWSYLWNPTGAAIGAEAGYAALTASGNSYDTSGAADAINAADNGNVLGVSTNGTITSNRLIGGLSAANSSDGNDHYVILGYTVQAGEDGTTSVRDNDSGGNQNGGTYLIYLNDTLVSTIAAPAGDANFDVSIGDTVVGDDIYVAFRQNDVVAAENTRNRNRSFLNFEIDSAPVPEPASLALVGLGGLAMLGRRRG